MLGIDPWQTSMSKARSDIPSAEEGMSPVAGVSVPEKNHHIRLSGLGWYVEIGYERGGLWKWWLKHIINYRTAWKTWRGLRKQRAYNEAYNHAVEHLPADWSGHQIMELWKQARFSSVQEANRHFNELASKYNQPSTARHWQRVYKKPEVIIQRHWIAPEIPCGRTKAPVGWFCTREIGHEGPCAAHEVGL